MSRAVAIVVLLASTTAIAMQPTFSTRVEGIRVDVLVTDAARRPMRGLTAADFSIRDNGVPQQVEVISFGETSLNVGLAFDLSDSVAGDPLDRLRAASQALITELLPADRVALVTFDKVVTLRCALVSSRDCAIEALADAAPDSETALVDGVFAGMMAGESEAGRSLLMVFSDGLDTASWLNPNRVLDMGRRSDVVVYPIASKSARPEFLDQLADLTGGRLHEVGRDDDLSATFRAILDEFRYRYLVTYTPKNVPKDGWHKLEVKVNRAGARVKARPGYQGG